MFGRALVSVASKLFKSNGISRWLLSSTGFGDTGPLADAPAFDSLIQGRASLVLAEGCNAGMPAVTPFNMVNKVTGIFRCTARFIYKQVEIYIVHATWPGIAVDKN